MVEDRIELALVGDPALLEATTAHREYLVGETLAVELHVGDQARASALEHREETQIDGLALTIALRRAARQD